MIDHLLIENSTEYTKQRFQQVSEITKGLCVITEFLEPSLLHKLLRYCKQENLEWVPERSPEGKLLPSFKTRSKLNFIADTPIEETHIVIENLTETLNSLFSRKNKFNGITIWKDVTGYQIGEHTDNPIIDFALQVYLTDNIKFGTKFFLDIGELQLHNKKNLCYLMDNTCNIRHSFDSRILQNNIKLDNPRYSLYASWSKE